MQKRTGLLLVNLGSPKSPSNDDVKIYLKQFLNDPYVIDLPSPLRWLLVNAFILNVRPQKTAEAYEKIWTPDGSPLFTHTRALTRKIIKKAGFPVEFGMRYGEPGIESAIKKLIHQGVNHIVLLPLYPQFSFAASETAIVEFERILKTYAGRITHSIIEDFYEHPAYIEAQAAAIRPYLEKHKPDLLMLSYHGVPIKQLTKTRNSKNYHEHCLRTSELLADALPFPREKMKSTFQSRLGLNEWVKPFTDLMLRELPAQGTKNILVASPSFTADCLETLEEIQIRYRELFLKSGGENFEYAPCVNSNDDFVDAILKIAEDHIPLA
jgi:ferrochelatase